MVATKMTSIYIPQTRCRAAIARCDITPPVGIYHRMWGAATHDRATGVHRPLLATLLWLEPEEHRSEAAYVHTYRFPLGDAFRSWVSGVGGRLGCPTPRQCEFLTRIETWDQAQLLKRLSRDARSWADLIEQWPLVSGS